MDFDDTLKNKNNSKYINSTNWKNKQEFELIKKYLNSQPEKLTQLNNISKTLRNIINNFVEYTKTYSQQIEHIAMKMMPDYTLEGQFMQAIQTVLLFYSEGLNKLTSKLKMNINFKKTEDSYNILDQFSLQKKLYYQKIKSVDSSHKSFKKEINLYQEYLVNKEYIEHMKKGDLINTDDAIIDINDNQKDVKQKSKSVDINEEEDPFEVKLSDVDNKNELIQTNQEYVKNINESNDLLNKIRKFLSIEISNIMKGIFNLSHHFIEGLLINSETMKKNFETQTEVINNLLNNITREEGDKTCLTDLTIKLKYLDIYNNNVLSKSDLYSEVNKNLIKQNKTIKNNSRKNSEYSINKIDEKFFQKNRISVLPLGKKGSKEKIDIPERKTIAFSNKQLQIKYLNRATLNPNQMNDFLDEEREEKFEEIVKKLNRDEILNIFEQIKDTNITLNELDIKLIEYEKNYKKIKEILVKLFIHPDKFEEDDKKSLIDFFEKDKNYILYFIKVLNDHRAKGNFYISELTLKFFGEIFKYLNNMILKSQDMKLFKYILILSMTYFYYSEKEDKKTYLFIYIKDCPNYSDPKFWEAYLKEMIIHDLKNSNTKNIDLDNINLDTLKKDEKEKISNSFFSNFLTVSKTMSDFNLSNKFIIEFIQKNKDKYYLSQEQIANINLLLGATDKDAGKNDNKENDVKPQELQTKNDDNIDIKEIKTDIAEKDNNEDNNNKIINENDNFEKKEIDKEEVKIDKVEDIKKSNEEENIKEIKEENKIIEDDNINNIEIKEKDNILENKEIKEEKKIINEESIPPNEDEKEKKIESENNNIQDEVIK